MYKIYIDNEQFNFQVNLFLADFFKWERRTKRSNSIYEELKRIFYKSLDISNLIFEDVKYKNGFMAVARINHPNADRTLIFHDGFDS